MISNSEYIWFKIFNIKGMGTKGMHRIRTRIREQNLAITDLEYMSKEEFNDLGFSDKIYDAWKDMDDTVFYDQFEYLIDKGMNQITPDSEDYPDRLIEILNEEAPPIIFYMGNKSLLNARSVAVIGSRNVTDSGKTLTGEITTDLAQNGFNIVSGYAKGVDTIAHISSLEVGGTSTFVLSYGITRFAQKSEFRNQSDMERSSLIMSQFAPNMSWLAQNAMQRNLTIVGLSRAVIVVQSGPSKDEKGRNSGTFASGKSALKYGVPLYVVKPELVENASGNEDLLKMGAYEITPQNALEMIIDQEENEIKNGRGKQLSFID